MIRKQISYAEDQITVTVIKSKPTNTFTDARL